MTPDLLFEYIFAACLFLWFVAAMLGFFDKEL